MDYHNPSDSSGTDDDLAPNPPPNHANTNRMTRGARPSGNGRATGPSSFARLQGPALAEQHTRRLELEAYTAVLRAFGAQSESISWNKDLLMADMRKELRISDEQHRESLIKVQAEEDITQIREWRKQEATPHPNAPAGLLEPSPSPAVSQSRKRQKTAHVTSGPAVLPHQPPPPLLKPAPVSVAPAPSPKPSKRGVPVGPRGKKTKGGRQPAAIPATTPKAGAPPSGRGSNLGRGPTPARAGAVASEAPADHHLGRKVKTRWPEDNNFYEAVITDYDQEKGMHALVYDMGTSQETWEWVNLKEMDTSDMKWVDSAPISLVNKGGSSGPPPPSGRGSGRGTKRGGGGRGGSVAGAGRARGAARGQATTSAPANVPIAQTRSWRGPAANENGLERKGGRPLQIPVVDPLLKEVFDGFDWQAENLKDITDIEKLEAMKRKAKAQGEALRSALAELGESSEEAGSDDGGHGSSLMRMNERGGGNRIHRGTSRDPQDDTDEEEDTAGDDRGEGSDGDQMIGEEGGASDGEQQMVEAEEDDEDG